MKSPLPSLPPMRVRSSRLRRNGDPIQPPPLTPPPAPAWARVPSLRAWGGEGISRGWGEQRPPHPPAPLPLLRHGQADASLAVRGEGAGGEAGGGSFRSLL